MPYVAAMLRWPLHERPDTIKHPVTGQGIDVHVISLQLVEDTLVLSDVKSPDFPDEVDAVDFYASKLANGWPECAKLYWSPEEVSIHAHHILFTLMYGYPISLKAIHEGTLQMTAIDVKHEDIDYAAAFVSLVGSYAELYSCLQYVGEPLLKLLTDHPAFWQCVAARPADALRLATKFKNKDVYFDAFRHLVAAAVVKGWNEMTDVFEMTEDECRAWVQPCITRVLPKVDALKIDLHRLQLLQSYSTYCSTRTKVHTTHQNILEHNPPRNTEMLASRQRAANVFGQWYIQHLYGNRLYTSSSGKPLEDNGGSLGSAIFYLANASTWYFPGAVFGQRVIKSQVEEFSRGAKYQVRKQLEHPLSDTVREAAAFIKQHLPDGEKEEIIDAICTYRHTKFTKKCEGVTYLPLDEQNVPWAGEEAWPGPAELKELSTVPASTEWLSALGIKKTRSNEQTYAKQWPEQNQEEERDEVQYEERVHRMRRFEDVAGQANSW